MHAEAGVVYQKLKRCIFSWLGYYLPTHFILLLTTLPQKAIFVDTILFGYLYFISLFWKKLAVALLIYFGRRPFHFYITEAD